ncbi:hypothetical protein FKM82_013513 [Ascaphus truei]
MPLEVQLRQRDHRGRRGESRVPPDSSIGLATPGGLSRKLRIYLAENSHGAAVDRRPKGKDNHPTASLVSACHSHLTLSAHV